MSTSPFDADRGLEEPRRRRRRAAGEAQGRRRGDPNATVPDVEFESYYGRNIVHEPPWEAGVPAYIFLGGMSAGAALMAAGGHLTGRPTLRERARYASMAALGVGAVALVTDLGRPERFLNMMRTVKLTSPMSVGSWILTGFGTFTGGALALELARKVLPDKGIVGTTLAIADPVMSAGSAFFAPPLAAYTAVLLADTATPLWHESYHELPFIFVSSGTAAGAGLAQIFTSTSETGHVRVLAVVGAACDLIADDLLRRRLGDEMGEPLHHGKAARLHQAARALTGLGALGSAFLGGLRTGAVLSGLALMAGSACTRFAVFEAGMASARDPKYTVIPQRRRAAAARAAGRGADQPGGQWPSSA